MPITSATNPPMNWGYARTWEGFLHALSRGQYGSAAPINMFDDPFPVLIADAHGVARARWRNSTGSIFCWRWSRFCSTCWMQKRERAWVIGITAIYVSLAGLLMMMLNTNPDRQSQELNRVFFAASHVLIAMGVGYGLTLIAACMAHALHAIPQGKHSGRICGVGFAFFALIIATQDLLSNALDTNTIMNHGFGQSALLAGHCHLFFHGRSRTVPIGTTHFPDHSNHRPLFVPLALASPPCWAIH